MINTRLLKAELVKSRIGLIIQFPTQGRLFAYIKTYISRKLVLENQCLRRTRVKDENGKPVIKREYLTVSIP